MMGILLCSTESHFFFSFFCVKVSSLGLLFPWLMRSVVGGLLNAVDGLVCRFSGPTDPL